MASEQKAGPAAEVRIGRVKATIWRNERDDGEGWYVVQLLRLYKADEEWKRTSSLGRDDLLLAAKVLDLAHTRIYELQAIGASEAA